MHSDDALTLSVPGLDVAPLPPRRRFSLRCVPADLTGIQAVWPTTIPTLIGATAEKAGYAALCLGPDEWLLFAPDSSDLEAAFATIAADCVHSLTDVSDRSVGIQVSGEGALGLLAGGTALDPAVLAPETATRTYFGRVEALIWRPTPAQVFEIEVWRSFADYLRRFVQTVAAEG